jgi:hypothetical protein
MIGPKASPAGSVRSSIIRLRGQNVMLDSDLCSLYGVNTKALKQAVRRNRTRFPPDFMFELTLSETRATRAESGRHLRSQTVTSSWGGRRDRAFAFTEQGVAMLSSVLRSRRAIAVNIEVMRAFVQLRRMLDSNAEFTRKLEALERKYDGQFSVVFEAIRQLMAPPPALRRAIGFRTKG